MNNSISQSIITLNGINSNLGKEVIIVAFKVLSGVKDSQSMIGFDLKSRYVLMNISKNREFRLNPSNFALRDGFEYELGDIVVFCQANDWDAWISDSSDGTQYKIT